jgi:hypothetical protein
MATSKITKVWKVSGSTETGFMVTPDTVVMAANEKNFIVVDQNGVNISGPLSIMTTSDNIRQGGLFVQQNDFVKMIPGTIVTPIPQHIPMPPVALFASIAKSIPILMALLPV